MNSEHTERYVLLVSNLDSVSSSFARNPPESTVNQELNSATSLQNSVVAAQDSVEISTATNNSIPNLAAQSTIPVTTETLNAEPNNIANLILAITQEEQYSSSDESFYSIINEEVDATLNENFDDQFSIQRLESIYRTSSSNNTATYSNSRESFSNTTFSLTTDSNINQIQRMMAMPDVVINTFSVSPVPATDSSADSLTVPNPNTNALESVAPVPATDSTPDSVALPIPNMNTLGSQTNDYFTKHYNTINFPKEIHSLVNDDESEAIYTFLFYINNATTNVNPPKRIRLDWKPNIEVIEILNDYDFHKYFCLKKVTALRLLDEFINCSKISKKLTNQDRNCAFRHLLIAYHYYSSGEYDIEFSLDHKNIPCILMFQIPPQNLVQIVQHVSRFIVYHIGKYHLRFPLSEQDITKTKSKFLQKFGVPKIIGCLDAFHISIYLAKQNASKYNSINAEVVADADLYITSVRVFPGFVKDHLTFHYSPIRQRFLKTINKSSNKYEDTNFLFVDEAYPLESCLLPPYDKPKNRNEKIYNQCHDFTFNETVKHAIGLMRSKFRCLLKHHPTGYNPTDAVYIIRACVVLYNILMKFGEIDVDMTIFEYKDMEGKIADAADALPICPLANGLRKDFTRQLAEIEFHNLQTPLILSAR